jgi:hypothetical protein
MIEATRSVTRPFRRSSNAIPVLGTWARLKPVHQHRFDDILRRFRVLPAELAALELTSGVRQRTDRPEA